MRIVHICLSSVYTDNWNYQENMLPKFHCRAGHDVSVIASEWALNRRGQTVRCKNRDYIDKHGIHIIRLRIKGKNDVTRKLKRYEHFYQALSECRPDILFIHNLSFLDIRTIVLYLHRHKGVTVYADNHADFSNSATNLLSKYLLHKGIWRYQAKKLAPYVKKFYGVLPARVDFLSDIYGIPKEKCSLLVLGADDDEIQKAASMQLGKEVRRRHGILPDDFLIVSGGKIDWWKKQTITLMKAVRKIRKNSIRLIVFGPVEDKLKPYAEKLADGKCVQYVQWVSAEDSYGYFAASDLAVFPGRHSVFWEQAAGQGVPMLVKSWEGTHHIDAGGNVKFLYEDTLAEMIHNIAMLAGNGEEYRKMKAAAQEKAVKKFSYKAIAKASIEM